MRSFALLIFLTVCTLTYSQSDTIFKMNGEILPVNVTKITESTIEFVYPGESFTNSINKSSVVEIHFKSGRKQEFSSSLNISRVKSCLDWKTVQVSNISDEVKGLLKIENIGAKAKGNTVASSLAKLQERTYNKLKIETAMLGGNVAYIIDQHTEEGMSGWGSSKAPSVTVTGLAYTTKKALLKEVKEGKYKTAKAYVLKVNKYSLDDYDIDTQTFDINKTNIYTENGFLKIKLNIKSIPKIKDYTIMYADSSKIILSGIYLSNKSKKTYYNIFLDKE